MSFIVTNIWFFDKRINETLPALAKVGIDVVTFLSPTAAAPKEPRQTFKANESRILKLVK